MENIYDFPYKEENIYYLSDMEENGYYLSDKEENINDLSDKDWKKLCQEIKPLSYIEKVKILYDRFGFVKGKVKRIIEEKEYEISLFVATPEEDLQRWEYYVEQKAKAYCKDWMDNNASGMDRAEDRTRTIEVLLNDIQNELKVKDDLKWGYKYGIKKTGLGSLELERFNIVSLMTGVARGLGLYYAELELKRLQEDSKEEEIKEDFPNLDLLTNRQKLTLAMELGLIGHLRREFDWVNHKKSNLGNLLCLLFGINLNSESAYAMIKEITKMDSGDPNRSPINSKNLKATHKQLAALGFNTKDLKRVKK
jgi:hypothetical protein